MDKFNQYCTAECLLKSPISVRAILNITIFLMIGLPSLAMDCDRHCDDYDKIYVSDRAIPDGDLTLDQFSRLALYQALKPLRTVIDEMWIYLENSPATLEVHLIPEPKIERQYAHALQMLSHRAITVEQLINGVNSSGYGMLAAELKEKWSSPNQRLYDIKFAEVYRALKPCMTKWASICIHCGIHVDDVDACKYSNSSHAYSNFVRQVVSMNYTKAQLVKAIRECGQGLTAKNIAATLRRS